MKTIQHLKSCLNQIITILKPFESFYNCHMVNYLTNEHWKTFIPEIIQNSIRTENDIDEAIHDIWIKRNQNTKFNDLLQFVENVERLQIDNLNMLTTIEDLFDIIIDKDNKGLKIINMTEILSIKEFMNEKKRHEVEIMANFVNSLIESQSNKSNFVIVDAGDGKGYLSSRLSLEYNLKILGIDANEKNTENAQKRNQKLQKAWNGLTKRAELINQGIKPPKRGKRQKIETNFNGNHQQKNHSENYKTISEFITTNLDLQNLINKNFCTSFANTDKSPDSNICLTGLHTCGNLASTCLKVFNAQKSIKIVCNIGCCYHLLKEKFCDDNFYTNKKVALKNSNDIGFPLSKYLKKCKFHLGRNARMLALQSIQRTCTSDDFMKTCEISSSSSLYYRALLEICIKEFKPELQNQIQVGKIKKFTTFESYLEKCDKKLQLKLLNSNKDNNDDVGRNNLITEEWLNSLMKKYNGKDRKFLNLFYLIRISFAPVLETIILLDRLLYLKENNFENSFIIKLFDPIVSPRCYGIVSMR